MDDFCVYILNDFLNYSMFIRHLGEGSFGTVELVQTNTNQQYAVKTIPIDTYPENNIALPTKQYGITSSALWDIDSLVRLRTAPDIIHLEGICDKENLIAIIMQPMQENLADFTVNTSINVRFLLLMRLMHTLVRAAALMETLNIIHFDIKPQNILVQNTGMQANFKVTDFGLARGGYTIPTAELFTLWYRPPEFLANRDRQTFNVKAGDIWAIGVTLLDFLVGKALFAGKTSLQILQKIKLYTNTQLSLSEFIQANREGTITGNVNVMALLNAYLDPVYLKQLSSQFIAIVSSMLVLNPADRANAITILAELGEQISPQYILSLLPEEHSRQININSINLLYNLNSLVNRATLLISIELLTRYLTQQVQSFTDLNAITLATLWIASKYNDNNPLRLMDLLNYYKNMQVSTLSMNQIINAERELLRTLQFKVYNLNLTLVIQRVYQNNIELVNVSPNIYAEPLDHWFINY